MRFIAGAEGMLPVQEAPEPRETHPVRLVTTILVNGEWEGHRESAYPDIETANTDLEHLGREVEDIVLVECEGGTPDDFGFPTAAY